DWEGDLIISYLAQWIIPAALLEKAKFAAINLHPGPPDYPGIGCTNFAIYNGEKEFGITCHHMQPRVDSGAIVAVRRFPVLEHDTVYSITQRCYVEIIHLFYELMTGVLNGKGLPQSTEIWTRKPYTRKQLNALCELSPDLGPEEIERRVKATTYGNKIWAYYLKDSEKIPYSYGGCIRVLTRFHLSLNSAFFTAVKSESNEIQAQEACGCCGLFRPLLCYY